MIPAILEMFSCRTTSEDGEAHSDRVGVGRRQESFPSPGDKHAQTLTYESAEPTQMCLPCQGTATQFTASKQVWDVGTTFVSLGSQRPGGGSQKYPRCSALGTRQEEEVELGGEGQESP